MLHRRREWAYVRRVPRAVRQGPGRYVAGLSSSYGKGDLLGELPAGFDLDVLWYPQLLPDVPARVLYYPGHTVVVAKGTDANKAKAAKDFAAFITSREEQAAMPGLDVGLLPARVDIEPKSLEVIGPVMSTMYQQLAKFGTDDFYDVRASRSAVGEPDVRGLCPGSDDGYEDACTGRQGDGRQGHSTQEG